MEAQQSLPGTGRGTSRRLVVGARLQRRAVRIAPTTALRAVPLPLQGRIFR
jgi:hypothetical protein